MINRMKNFFHRLRVWYWRRFKPSKYGAYIGGVIAADLAAGMKDGKEPARLTFDTDTETVKVFEDFNAGLTHARELLRELAEAVAAIPTPTDAERLNLAVPWRKERRHTPKYIGPTKRQQIQRIPARVARSSCPRRHG